MSIPQERKQPTFDFHQSHSIASYFIKKKKIADIEQFFSYNNGL